MERVDRRMANAACDTKLTLLLAAGELFAENGLDGTSIRAIAEKAGANIAAVNYHFGSKENLYREVLRYVVTENQETSAAGYLEEARRATAPHEFSGIIHRLVHARFRDYLAPDKPQWTNRLLIRSFLRPSHVLEDIVRDQFVPDRDALIAIFQLARPGMPYEEARLLMHALSAQICFYIFARTPLLMSLGREEYDPVMVKGAADLLARVVTRELGLPGPCP
jgi:AcrR family transcriptional regulator